MLRHQTIAVALFLSAGCELAGAPPPEKPAPPAAAPAPAPTQKPEPELRPMMRGGPSWGKERPRFKAPLVAPPVTTPPDAATPAPSK